MQIIKKKKKQRIVLSAAFIITFLISFSFYIYHKRSIFSLISLQGKTQEITFLHRGVKLWTRNLFPHRTFQMESHNFASLRQNKEYFHHVSHRALPLWPLHRSIIKNLCSYLFVLNRKQSLSSLLISLKEKALSGLHSELRSCDQIKHMQSLQISNRNCKLS